MCTAFAIKNDNTLYFGRTLDLEYNYNENNLLEKIKTSLPSFSKGQKAIGTFILNNYDTSNEVLFDDIQYMKKVAE